MRRSVLYLFVILATFSCDEKDVITVQWGPDAKPDCGPWLTFSYDKAIYFHDTSGTLFKHLVDDASISAYARSQQGKDLNQTNIENLDEILSCRIFCGDMEDSVVAAISNPEHLVVFLDGENNLQAYVSADFYSGVINSKPVSKSTERCALGVFFQSLH